MYLNALQKYLNTVIKKKLRNVYKYSVLIQQMYLNTMHLITVRL